MDKLIYNYIIIHIYISLSTFFRVKIHIFQAFQGQNLHENPGKPLRTPHHFRQQIIRRTKPCSRHSCQRRQGRRHCGFEGWLVLKKMATPTSNENASFQIYHNFAILRYRYITFPDQHGNFGIYHIFRYTDVAKEWIHNP